MIDSTQRDEYKRRVKTPDQALESLRMVCAKMERSVVDVRNSLYRWGVSPDEHETIIESLIRDKFIDLQRYANAYVRDKLSAGRWGKAKIASGLRAKGIPRENIAQALEQLEQVDMDAQLLDMLRRRADKNSSSLSRYELKGRLFR